MAHGMSIERKDRLVPQIGAVADETDPDEGRKGKDARGRRAGAGEQDDQCRAAHRQQGPQRRPWRGASQHDHGKSHGKETGESGERESGDDQSKFVKHTETTC